MMKIVDSFGAGDDQSSAKKLLGEGKIRSFGALVKQFFGETNQKNTKEQDEFFGHARGVLVGSFIAVLELMKRGVVSASQDLESAEIRLSLKIDASEGARAITNLESEFDSARQMYEE